MKTADAGKKGMEVADRPEILSLRECLRCGAPVRKKQNAQPKVRTIFRMETNRIVRVKYVKPRYYCPKCKKEVLPEIGGMPPNAKFDCETALLFSFMKADMGMSYREIVSFCFSSFKVKLSPATVGNSIRYLHGLPRPQGLGKGTAQ